MDKVLGKVTESEIKKLSLRSIAAYAARIARRVQPCYIVQSAHVDSQRHIASIETAIQITESHAAGNMPPKPQAELAMIATEKAASFAQEWAAWGGGGAPRAADAATHAVRVSLTEDGDVAAKSANLVADAACDAVVAACCDLDGPALAGYNVVVILETCATDFEKLLAFQHGEYSNLGQPINPHEDGPLGAIWIKEEPWWYRDLKFFKAEEARKGELFPTWAAKRLSIELTELRAKGEGQNLEYMRAFPNQARDLAKEIAAFATSGGGVILIGVDNNGSLVGVEDIQSPEQRDQLIRRVEGIAHGTVKPPITPSVAFAWESGKAVLCIEVPRGTQPVYYCDHKPYVRHLTESRPAEPDEVVDLFRLGNRGVI